jgi:hypothetical protein
MDGFDAPRLNSSWSIGSSARRSQEWSFQWPLNPTGRS